VLALDDGRPGLLVDVMRGGRRTYADTLAEARERARAQRGALASEHRRVDAAPYEVRVDPALDGLRFELASTHGGQGS